MYISNPSLSTAILTNQRNIVEKHNREPQPNKDVYIDVLLFIICNKTDISYFHRRHKRNELSLDFFLFIVSRSTN